MPCYSVVSISGEILALNPTEEEKIQALRALGMTSYSIGRNDQIIARLNAPEIVCFKREIQMLRSLATAKRQGYKNVNVDRQQNRIVIRVSD